MDMNGTPADQLAQLAYSKFASHYSIRNWFSNEVPWLQLSEADQKFWKEFILGIKSSFKVDFIESAKTKSLTESAK
jgi:hypothetical protein